MEDRSSLESLAKDFESAWLLIQRRALQGDFTIEQLTLFDEQAARIKSIALLFSSLERKKCELIDQTKEDAHFLFSKGLAASSQDQEKHIKCPKEKPVALVASSQETLNSKLLRRWFLDNIADPFPSRRTKEELIAETNALVETAPPAKKSRGRRIPVAKSNQPIDYAQCSLWFVNSRRRSNWTEFFRDFARSDKALMCRLVECLKREEGVEEPSKNEDLEKLLRWDDIKRECNFDDSPEAQSEAEEMAARVKECREMYTHILEWVQQITKDKVGDWMDEVIREAKQQVKEEKAERRLELKRRADELEQAHVQRGHDRQKVELDRQALRAADVNIRQMDRTLRRKEAERKQRSDNRRLPSTFRTPDINAKQTHFSESSIRNVSNGSTTWTSSGDSQYAPSLFEKHSLRSSSSSSSIASYDNFVRIPASPTLSILKNNQPFYPKPASLEAAQSEATLPVTNLASLYTSDLAPPYRPMSRSSSGTSPALLHLETELSGGACSPLARTISQASSSSNGTGHLSPWSGWQG
jgi:hypothetical protein